MKRLRTAALLAFIQAILLPILFGSVSGPGRAVVILIQILIAIPIIGLFFGARWAIWIVLGLMAIQVPAIETERAALRVNLGTSLCIGVFPGDSVADARIGVNWHDGYWFNFAYSHPPVKRTIVLDPGTTGAFLVNLAVLPVVILLLGPAFSRRAQI